MLVDADLLERAEAAHRRAWPGVKHTVRHILSQSAAVRRLIFGYDDPTECCLAILRAEEARKTDHGVRWWER